MSLNAIPVWYLSLLSNSEKENIKKGTYLNMYLLFLYMIQLNEYLINRTTKSKRDKIVEQMKNILGCNLQFEEVFNSDDYGPYEYFKDGNIYDIYNISCFDNYWAMLISHETNRIGFISQDGDVPTIINGKIEYPHRYSQNDENACHTVEEWESTDIKNWLKINMI